jgi:hypothetical protein
METSFNNTHPRQSGGEARSHAGRQQLINGIQSSYIVSLIGGVTVTDMPSLAFNSTNF